MSRGGPGRDDAEDSPDDDAPLADLADDVARRRERHDDDRIERAFSEESFEAIEEESVWTAIEEEDTSDFGAIGEVVEAGDRTYVVSKRNFCERCRFFGEPPDAHCTHPGTEIREFVDMNHVRLYACPIVEERGLEDVRLGD